jgi:serine O-acetyltransferase
MNNNNNFEFTGGWDKLPSKAEVTDFTSETAIYLFPQLEGGKQPLPGETGLREKLFVMLEPVKERLAVNREVLAENFFSALPLLRSQLADDALFIASNDPASTCVDEVIMTYPGFFAILVYRLANNLAVSGVPLIPRIMTEYAHSMTGIDIHPKATIGSPFFIDHGTGIVIGETSVIGKGVKLFQGVTIGALCVNKSMASMKRHPTVEDNTIIYAGSTILGGNTIIGHDCIIGGNVWCRAC